MEHRIAQLEREVETLLGMLAGLQTAIASLIATHPNYHHLQMHLVSATEIADLGVLRRNGVLTAPQLEVARAIVESLQRIREVPAQTIPPYRRPAP